VIYDISHPYDLRVALGKPTMTTDEIDRFLGDPEGDPEVRRQLLVDAQGQGYPGPSSTGNASSGVR